MNAFLKISAVLFLFISVTAYAQDKENDSLKTAIEQSKDDTVKVNMLIELSKRYLNISPDASKHFAELASKLGEKLNFMKGVAYAHKYIGLFYTNKSEYIEGINHYKKAMHIFDSIGNKAGIANIQSNLGIIYSDQGDDEKALEYYFSALKIAEEINDTLRMATVLSNMAVIYSRKPNSYKKALDNYRRCFELSKIIGDMAVAGTAAAGMGEIYLEGDSASLDTAIYYFEKSLKFYKGTFYEPYTLNDLGKVFRKKHDYEKAIQYQKDAVEMAKKFDARNDVATYLSDLAFTYQATGDTKQALATYKEAEIIAFDLKATYLLKDIYEGKAKAYGLLHDYSNGFKYQYLLIGVKDTIYQIETDKKLQGIQFHFELQKKEGEINLLTKDKKIQEEEIKRQKLVKNGFVGGFAVVLLFAGIFFSQRNKISKGKKRSDELLLNILPSETAEELKATGTAKTKSFELVTVMFTDFKNFTQASEKLTPEELVAEINTCYSEFDRIVTKYGIEKIKTIGDSYMCAGGLPVANPLHPANVIRAGIEMQMFIEKNKAERIAKGQPFFDLRLGIHSGPVVAGIVGTKKFAYDIWGDTVNTASRMESSSEIGKVNISGTTYELVKDKFKCKHRGKVEAKNKGQIDMYFVESEILS